MDFNSQLTGRGTFSKTLRYFPAAIHVLHLHPLRIHAIKSKIRFATLHETAAEYQVTKREEEVTSKLFSTIIPKHVSDKFLTELR